MTLKEPRLPHLLFCWEYYDDTLNLANHYSGSHLSLDEAKQYFETNAKDKGWGHAEILVIGHNHVYHVSSGGLGKTWLGDYTVDWNDEVTTLASF